MNDLIEYLYVDRARLRAYADQIGSSRTYDKVPMWSVELGITGLSAKSEQARVARETSQHEQIAALLKHLTKRKQVSAARASHSLGSHDPPFRLETTTASRAVVRATAESAERSVRVWVSRSEVKQPVNGFPSVPGALFLIEDDLQDDQRRPRQYSSYTWMALLEDELAEAGLGRLFDEHGDPAGRARRSSAESVKDPISVMTQLGARFGPERRITVLYRVRAACMTRAGTVTVGYPVVIAEGSAFSAA